jgi:hypothetical protein
LRELGSTGPNSTPGLPDWNPRAGGGSKWKACGFRNASELPVRLREIVLCDTPNGGLQCDGSAAGWLVSTDDSLRIGNLAEVLRPHGQ